MSSTTVCFVTTSALLACLCVAVGTGDWCGITRPFALLNAIELPYSVNDTSGYTYKFNICGNLSSRPEDPDHAYNQSSIVQFKSYSGQFVSRFSRGIGNFSVINSTAVNNVLGGGDVCFPTPNPRTANILLVCGKSLIPPPTDIAVAASVCHVSITFPTSLACTVNECANLPLDTCRTNPACSWCDSSVQGGTGCYTLPHAKELPPQYFTCKPPLVLCSSAEANQNKTTCRAASDRLGDSCEFCERYNLPGICVNQTVGDSLPSNVYRCDFP